MERNKPDQSPQTDQTQRHVRQEALHGADPTPGARDEPERIHDAAPHERKHVSVTRQGSTPVVLLPHEDYEEYTRLKREQLARQMADSLAHLQRGEPPPGAEKVTAAQLEDGSWLA